MSRRLSFRALLGESGQVGNLLRTDEPIDRFPAVLCRGEAESFIFQSVHRSRTAHRLLVCEQKRAARLAAVGLWLASDVNATSILPSIASYASAAYDLDHRS